MLASHDIIPTLKPKLNHKGEETSTKSQINP